MQFRRVALSLTLAGALIAVGCAKSPYELAPVVGVVQIEGRPFSEGKVMFAPIARGRDRKAGRPAFGRLAADGSFSLTTNEPGDGAVVGEHWVTVIRIEAESPAAATSSTPPFARVAVPQKVTVVAGQENKIDVRLTRQEIARFGVLE
jgi:hypothetical protein